MQILSGTKERTVISHAHLSRGATFWSTDRTPRCRQNGRHTVDTACNEVEYALEPGEETIFRPVFDQQLKINTCKSRGAARDKNSQQTEQFLHGRRFRCSTRKRWRRRSRSFERAGNICRRDGIFNLHSGTPNGTSVQRYYAVSPQALLQTNGQTVPNSRGPVDRVYRAGTLNGIPFVHCAMASGKQALSN